MDKKTYIQLLQHVKGRVAVDLEKKSSIHISVDSNMKVLLSSTGPWILPQVPEAPAVQTVRWFLALILQLCISIISTTSWSSIAISWCWPVWRNVVSSTLCDDATFIISLSKACGILTTNWSWVIEKITLYNEMVSNGLYSLQQD